jgi:hypothetical protein
MYNKWVMDGFSIQFISVEVSTISKKQTQFIKDLKEELLKFWIKIPVYLYDSKVNKYIRIKDNLESIMSMQWLRFNRNMTDKWFVSKAETQFLEYPNGDHDDVIDVISQWVEVFRKKSSLWEKKVRRVKKVRSAEEWKFIEITV